jgi:hypothetical protein
MSGEGSLDGGNRHNVEDGSGANPPRELAELAALARVSAQPLTPIPVTVPVLIALAYAFEQATAARRLPRFLPTAEPD